MLAYQVIGPGKADGNFLAGYFRPGTRIFVSLADCTTREQAYAECTRLRIEAEQRERAAMPPPFDWRPVRGFYTDDQI